MVGGEDMKRRKAAADRKLESYLRRCLEGIARREREAAEESPRPDERITRLTQMYGYSGTSRKW